jgi:ATP phosphoribosyltransferase regulatory subunit
MTFKTSPLAAPAALLPEGLRDVLPPHAEAEAALLRRLVDAMTAHGYERVAPPLVEFEDSLFGTHIEGAPRDVFRMMDPVSQRMLAVRADMTTQVARIAIDRLGHYARPLRLAYAGPVLRVRGSQLRADRQFSQAGAELVGQDDVAASAEVICVAAQAVAAAGLMQVTIDLTMPDLVTLLAKHAGLGAANTAAIRAALDGKDAAKLEQAAGGSLALFAPLLETAGPAEQALAQLQKVYGGGPAAQRIADMAELVHAIQARLNGETVTLDPTEYHGFQYQTWFGFSLFARGVRGEVGRGGAYEIARSDLAREKAVGFSIYLNGLVDAGAGIEPRQRIYLDRDVAEAIAIDLRRSGWVTVRALEDGDAADATAQRCTHIYVNGAPRVL